jgi:hypothetical protein
MPTEVDTQNRFLGVLDGLARQSPEGSAAALVRQSLATAATDVREGLALARAASTMVQSADSVELQCCAHLGLARMRRLTGSPHLALNILLQLESVVPDGLRPWLQWEMLLSGQPESGTFRSGSAEALLSEMLAAARVGNVADWQAAGEALSRCVAEAEPFATDAQLLLTYASTVHSSHGDAVPWRDGHSGHEQDAISYYGLGARSASGLRDPEVAAFVRVVPGNESCRVLRLALGFSPEIPVLAPDANAQGEGAGARAATAIAVLALAGPSGIDREQFFMSVYGFRFSADRHRGVLEVLIHRMRTRLGGFAEVSRDEGRLALVVASAFFAPDPRCVLPLPDRLVRSLAELGTPSAADAARVLGLPLRTVQAALAELVAEGICRVERQGRNVSYRVEDTTFTMAGLRPQ